MGCSPRNRALRATSPGQRAKALGYWALGQRPQTSKLMRCFVAPRGVLVNAGGYVKEDSKSFRLEAELGSLIYGVLSNRYLDDSYQTKRYSLTSKGRP